MSEPAAPVDVVPSDPLAAARTALDRHAWQAAFDAFAQADAGAPLSGDDLEAYAVAAFFVAQADAGVELKERAFKAYLGAGDPARAAAVALDVAREYGFMGKGSVAASWRRRAERLLADLPEGYAHGWLAISRSDEALATGDVATALEHAETAVRIGRQATDADLEATALTSLGRLKVATGATTDGIQMIEDAAFSAVNGELSPMMTGVTYCATIAACRDLTDYRRASEWTELAERWCKRSSVSGFPGICRVHRAEIVAIGGAWQQAEAELQRATSELAAYHAVQPMADGYYAMGEIRLRMGDLEGAEAALRSAHGLGRSPEPALALIRLARGDRREAAAAIDAAVAASWDRLQTLRLLPAQVEIAVANADPAGARAAAVALDDIAEASPSPAMQGVKAATWGRVLLAEGDAAGARRELETAIERWREVGAPYEIARARLLLADALSTLGDEASADLERRAARDEFERLGAPLDLAAAQRALSIAAARRGTPEQVRRTFLFTDIVGSTQLAATLGDAAWSDLLRWHDDTLRARFRTHGGEVVKTTGDGFFVAFDDAVSACACAIDLQTALAEHRRTSGSPLTVRVGLHTADANRQGDDYSGVGVHVAARIADLATGGEILASAATAAEAGVVTVGPPRAVAVKGVEEPVSVATLDWRASPPSSGRSASQPGPA